MAQWFTKAPCLLLLFITRIAGVSSSRYVFNLRFQLKVTDRPEVTVSMFDNNSDFYRGLQVKTDEDSYFDHNFVDTAFLRSTYGDSTANIVYKLKDIQPVGKIDRYLVWVQMVVDIKVERTQVFDRIKGIVKNEHRGTSISHELYYKTIKMTVYERPVCKEEKDDTYFHVWPDSEDSVQHYAICPTNKTSVNNILIRRCESSGWEKIVPFNCRPPAKPTYDCSNNSLVTINIFCIPQKSKHLRQTMTTISSAMLQQHIIGISSAVTATKTITPKISDSILTLLDALSETKLKLPGSLLQLLRNMIDEISLKTEINGTTHIFRSKHVAMGHYPIFPLISSGSNPYFNLSVEVNNSQFDLKVAKNDVYNIIIPIHSLVGNLSTKEKKNVEKIIIHVFRGEYLFGTHVIRSNVYSIEVAGLGDMSLAKNIILKFEHKKHDQSPIACVYWDKQLGVGGGWSTERCLTVANITHIACRCNHLSSFALMSLYDENQELIDRLNKISFLGCIISSIFLLFTLITYLSFRQLRTEITSKILTFVCANLLLSSLLYISNTVVVKKHEVQKSENEMTTSAGCRMTAIFLHYFLLASLSWMGSYGYFIYKALVEDSIFDKMILKLFLFAAVMPITITAITAQIDINVYGLVKGTICWLKGNASIFAFFLPVGMITAVKLFIFSVIFVKINRVSKSERSTKMNAVTFQLRGAVLVTVLLVLTWIFAFLTVEWRIVIFAYLFAAFNSFQGFFIFIYYCVFKETTRTRWLRLCCKPKEVVIPSTKTKTIGQTPIVYVNSDNHIIDDDKLYGNLKSDMIITDGHRESAVDNISKTKLTT